MLLNEITFAGNVGSECKTGTTQNGKEWAQFTLCHNEKGKDGRPDVPTWVRVVAFGYAVSDAKLAVKGANVVVRGKLQISKYKDKNQVEQTSVEINAYQIGVIQKGERVQQQQSASPPVTEPSLDEIPF
jgi:single stranded DNA-binding protein